MELKNLPRNNDGTFCRRFKANGNWYNIRTQQEGIGIVRLSEFMKMKIVVGMGMSISEIDNKIEGITSEINKFGKGQGDFLSAALAVHALRENILSIAKERYAMNFLFCCLFITRDDEDMTKWIIEDQNEKIDDWNEEGYNENDFLLLGLSLIDGYKETLNKYSQQPGDQQNL